MSTSPQTLLAMAGAKRNLPKINQSVLVLIDMQNEYVDGLVALPGANNAVNSSTQLLSQFRATNAPVIHVVHKGRPGGMFDPETKNFQIIKPLSPVGEELIIEKTFPNSFHQTTLKQAIDKTEKFEIIFAGFMTHMCVSSSVRAALDLSYNSFVVSDMCATRDLPDPTSDKSISAETIHTAALAGLADRFATIITSDDFTN